jgi:hypothetical protein
VIGDIYSIKVTAFDEGIVIFMWETSGCPSAGGDTIIAVPAGEDVCLSIYSEELSYFAGFSIQKL